VKHVPASTGFVVADVGGAGWAPRPLADARRAGLPPGLPARGWGRHAGCRRGGDRRRRTSASTSTPATTCRDHGALSDPQARARREHLVAALAKLSLAGDEPHHLAQAARAAVCVELDRTLGKARVLNLYLAIAPWGDGQCGAHDAARHYLHKRRRPLDATEAAWLASPAAQARPRHCALRAQRQSRHRRASRWGHRNLRAAMTTNGATPCSSGPALPGRHALELNC
jgi:hypothetical protein